MLSRIFLNRFALPVVLAGLLVGCGDGDRRTVVFSILCVLLGVMPHLIYSLLPYPVEYNAYTLGNVLFYLQLLLFSGLAFFLLLPLMKRTQTVTLDFDWLWPVNG